MKMFWAAIILAAAIVFVGSASNSPTKNQSINDVSWPNCGLAAPVQPNPGIVGINGGLDFRPNPCLGKQLSWFSSVSVYINTGYPGTKYGLKFQNSPKLCATTDQECLAYNYGFNAARYDIKYASLQGVVANRWWLDIETENSWTNSAAVNRSALQGMIDAFSRYASPTQLGVYSYPGQWDLLTGNWRVGLPAWVASGSTNRQAAAYYCSLPSFSGGPVLLAQYTAGLDIDISCQ